MWERLQKLLDRVESRWSLVVAIVALGANGAITAWFSAGYDWIDQFGSFGWWVAFLIGALLAALLFLAVAWARYAWAAVAARSKWSTIATTANPLEPEFRRQRIVATELINPFTKKIVNKKFYECEILGPVNIFIYGNTIFHNVDFVDCVGVSLRKDETNKVYPGNAAVLENVEMHGGAIYGATILVAEDMCLTLAKIGLPFVTLTGVPAIDSTPIYRREPQLHSKLKRDDDVR